MSYSIDRVLPVVLACSLAAAAVLGSSWAASAATGCIDKPNLHVNQAGHWYYHVDRAHHRRCWYFDGSEVTASPPARAEQALPANADANESWLSRLTTALGQTFSVEQQQNGALDDKAATTNAASQTYRRANRIAKKERPRIASVSETNGLASGERRAQPPLQSAAEKNEKPGSQLTPADHEALFKQFMDWYVERSMLARP